MTLSEEQKSEILRKEEEYQGEPYNKNVMGLSDKYVDEKGEGDYGVKKLAKVDDMAEGKAVRRKEIGGNAPPWGTALRLYFFGRGASAWKKKGFAGMERRLISHR